MSRELFGTDGLRGLAGKYPLDQLGAERIGRAVGTQFAKPGQTIVIARDPRESSESLSHALINGLNNVAVNVIDVGVITTPGLAYLTREGSEFKAGVMITASHNSYEYNGVKVFDHNGDKLTDESEVSLNRLIESEIKKTGGGKTTKQSNLTNKYIDFLVFSAKGQEFRGLKLAVDSANGAASGIASRVFEHLGAEVTALFDKPDGRNINDNCGATNPKSLSKIVTDRKLDLGIALDGDADRLILIDSRGREVNGDYILYILAATLKLDGLVATVMSNLGLEMALKKLDISLDRVKVGDRYVLEGLRRTGWYLGGEQSGHIIFPDLLATGDGLLAAVQVVRSLIKSDKNLAQWRDEVKMLPQSLVNIKLADNSLLELPVIKEFIKSQVEALDNRGRLLIRPSGTEPLVRVMVEADDAQKIADRISSELEQLIIEASKGKNQ
ncbi:MAG TPA: phosphoglucosamine mutase [Candidatus Saccharimonadales bacterium]|nr:phosphoglucosamine mutase [Candidatus Saccharimonadales bacterium]